MSYRLRKKSITDRSSSRRSLRRILRPLLLLWLATVLVVGSMAVWRTARFESKQIQVEVVPPHLGDVGSMIAHLSRALQIPTIGQGEIRAAPVAFYALHEMLRVSFPRIHHSLVRENISEMSLLYTWRGRDAGLAPIVLCAPLDVSAVNPSNWEHGPFSGQVVGEDYVYGRGALVDKSSLLAILEATELLLAEGFEPERTVYLALAHDSKAGGYDGARAISEILEARGVHAEVTLDQGTPITEGVVEGLAPRVALIGLAEKGHMRVELEVAKSFALKEGSVEPLLRQAMKRVSLGKMPASVSGAVGEMLAYLGPESHYGRKFVTANLWLFGNMVAGSLARADSTEGLVRTTVTASMRTSRKNAGEPDLPRALVNFSIRPGDSKSSVLAHLHQLINDDRIVAKILEYEPPQPASSSHSRAFIAMQRSLRSMDSSVVVAPSLMETRTDSRFYSGISIDTYRFSPVHLSSKDIVSLSGANERISVKNYTQMVEYYRRLLSALAAR